MSLLWAFVAGAVASVIAVAAGFGVVLAIARWRGPNADTFLTREWIDEHRYESGKRQ